MNEITTSVETETAAPKAKKTPANKGRPAKKAPKASADGRQPKPGWLPKAQVRILAALAKAKGPLNRHVLAQRADVPVTHVIGFALRQYATKPFPALAEIGCVRSFELDVEGRNETVFEITAKGRKALETATRK